MTENIRGTLQLFQTPKGEAGSDQLDAMEESIQAAIEQMFWQVAKRDSLRFGVGRSVATSSDNPDRALRLEAQKRECDSLIVFHAGKALETALHILYAKINNRIPGREYPSVPDRQMQEDRRTHSLSSLYSNILKSVEIKADLYKKIEHEFESIYQTAYHKGVYDLIIDDDLVDQLVHIEDNPFREKKFGGLRHGAEFTMDHSSFMQLLMPSEEKSEFSKMPYGTFREFLAKADVAYYGKRNMRWTHYSARDNELGRTYVTVGTRFFARLVQGLVSMANEQWMWNEQYAKRWHERRRILVDDGVRVRIRQNYEGNPNLPEMISADKMMERFRSPDMRSRRTDDYESLHVKLTFTRQQTNDGHNGR